MDKTIEISIEYSISGYDLWTKMYDWYKDKIYAGRNTFHSLKELHSSIDDFVKNHKDLFSNKKSTKRKVLKKYNVKTGWQFSVIIRDTSSLNVKNWRTLKLTSKNFNIDYRKLAEEKNYEYYDDFAMFRRVRH